MGPTGTGASACIGYTRVSTVSQTLGQQNAALEAAGVTKTFSDTMSGARDDDAVTIWPALSAAQNVLTLSMLTNIPWPVWSLVKRVPSGVAFIVQPCAS
jgi:resolvase-like protein